MSTTMMQRRVVHHPVGDVSTSKTSYSASSPNRRTNGNNNTTNTNEAYYSEEKSPHEKRKKQQVLRMRNLNYYDRMNYDRNKEIAILIICGVVMLWCGIYVGIKIMGGDDYYDEADDFIGGPARITHKRAYIDRWDKNTIYEKVPLKPSDIYAVPGSMDHIGDKSDAYAQLRRDYDSAFPLDDVERSMKAVRELQDKESYMPIMPSSEEDYNVYNCPMDPPQGYPRAWNLLDDVLKDWPADDASPRKHIYQGLCVFDYQTEYDKALHYRELELPFVIKNDPDVVRAAERWNTDDYVQRLLGNVKHRCEYSENNHFLYWTPPPAIRRRRRRSRRKNRPWFNNPKVEEEDALPSNWTEPTEMLRMRYGDWLRHANVSEDRLGPDQPHWYFRLISCGEVNPSGACDKGASEYLYDELPFFQPKNNLYVVEPEAQKGIHCRFGMKGVIAENHFDGSRNAIAVLGGARRYVLAHPDQCSNMALLPKGHPSARHSAVDWSEPDLEQYPDLKKVQANEVVLQPGEVLYLPTGWFHYIVSLTLNWQCNVRSGINNEYMHHIQECGF